MGFIIDEDEFNTKPLLLNIQITGKHCTVDEIKHLHIVNIFISLLTNSASIVFLSPLLSIIKINKWNDHDVYK